MQEKNIKKSQIQQGRHIPEIARSTWNDLFSILKLRHLNPSSKASNLLMALMSNVYTGKPDDKKEKGGDKADDKVKQMWTKQFSFTLKQLLKVLPCSVIRCWCYKSYAVASVLLCQQSKGTFSHSHYYLALYRFKAIEKDDLDFQYVWNSKHAVIFYCITYSIKHFIQLNLP